MKDKGIFYRSWVVLASAMISFWGGGIFYGITAFLKLIVEEFQ